MSEAIHTPGPLTVRRARVSDSVGGTDWAVVDAENRVIAECFEIVDVGRERRPAEANATLFAASPKLLRALKIAACFMAHHESLLAKTFGDDVPSSLADLRTRLAIARGAIVRAGGQPHGPACTHAPAEGGGP